MMNKDDWEYRPIADKREKELMSIGKNAYGWWTLIYTNDDVFKSVDVKQNEIVNNNWEAVVLVGKIEWEVITANEKRHMISNPNSPPYSVWGLCKSFTSHKTINYN
tara:strand:- start:174 stop:491 length:318 start_codon:yes stop_codon:yes gene_type:complete